MSTSLCAPTAPTAPTSTAPTRPPGPPRRAPEHRRGVRLTRRGRLLLHSSWVALAIGIGLMVPWGSSVPWGSLVGASSTHAAGDTTARVVIRQGDTLWQIARRVDSQTDPRITIERIRDLNGLPDSSVRAGAEIVVPVSGPVPAPAARDQG